MMVKFKAKYDEEKTIPEKLAFIDSVNWTYSHSGNGCTDRGIKQDSQTGEYYYLFASRGCNSSATYYTHTFRTNLIPIENSCILYFGHELLSLGHYSPSGRVEIYDKDGNVLYSSTTLNGVRQNITVPAGGFSVYSTYYGPGNWGTWFYIFDIQ